MQIERRRATPKRRVSEYQCRQLQLQHLIPHSLEGFKVCFYRQEARTHSLQWVILQTQQAQQYHFLEKKVSHCTHLRVNYIHGNRVVTMLKQLLPRVGRQWVDAFRLTASLRCYSSINQSINQSINLCGKHEILS